MFKIMILKIQIILDTSNILKIIVSRNPFENRIPTADAFLFLSRSKAIITSLMMTW